MEFLHPIDRTRKKENSHRAGLRSSFFSWAHALTSAQREVAYSGLRHALTRKQHEISLHGNAAMHCEDAEWKRQNREAAISEAQKRANQSGLDFTVFEVEDGSGFFGISIADEFQSSHGELVVTVKPQKKGDSSL